MMRPPVKSPDARQKFRERKWFDQVVVRSSIETADPIVYRSPRRQNQHRRSKTATPHLAQSLKAALPGQHHIEQNKIKSAAAKLPDSRFPRICEGYFISVAFQTLRNSAGKLSLVFDDENSKSILGADFACCAHSSNFNSATTS
jgi:hypothetical protein